MKTFFRIVEDKLYGVPQENLGFSVNNPLFIPDDYLNNQKFLVMRTCHGLGDWVILSAMPRLLKEKYPNCKVYLPSKKLLQNIFGDMLKTWGYGTFDAGDVKGGKYDQALPPDLFVTLLAITQLMEMVGGGEFESKLGFDPFTIVTDTDLRKVTALLKMMAKDKKFIEAVKQLQEGGPEAAPAAEDEGGDMAPPPDDMGAQDETLAAAMQ